MAYHDKKREDVAAAHREERTSARDIGVIPEVQDWSRRVFCENDLVLFLKTYLPEQFPIPFSAAHVRNLRRIQDVLLVAGRYIQAIPRGFGKSTMAEGAALWALFYGHRRFIPIITAGDASAEKHMKSIKGLLENSELLLADFPEICYPIRKLDGVPQRAGTQLYQGQRTSMEWGKHQIVFPFIPELDSRRRQCRGCGSIVTACGIGSSRIRGLKHTLPTNETIRPDFAFIDDPQDHDTAKSPAAVEKNLDILQKDIHGLGSHQKSLSTVIACNTIEREDMIERLMSPDDTNGYEYERVSLIEKFPDDLDGKWEEYRAILMGYDRQIKGEKLKAMRKATKFYQTHRAAMDRGAVATWPEAHDENTVSGIQYAMNIYYTTKPEAFAAEYQNRPLEDVKDEGQLTIDAVMAKVLPATKRGLAPTGAAKLTAFVDVQQKVLFWAVVAWGDGFSGHVVDYGTYPDQKKRYFTLRDLPRTLQRVYPTHGQEALWRQGLSDVMDILCPREFEREDGAILRVERAFIDANDGNAYDVVHEFCRQSRFPTVVMPYTSKGVRAGDRPFAEYAKKPGDVKGLNWRIPSTKGKKIVRRMLADVNYWKSFVRSRWLAPHAETGSLTLFAGSADEHRLFCEHMTSEYSTRTEGRGRVVDEWRVRPNQSENHWWDCLVGCAVGASMLGVSLPESGPSAGGERRRRITLAEARAKRGIPMAGKK